MAFSNLRESLLGIALAAGNAAISRSDVAARDVVVGVGQYFFGFSKYFRGFLGLTFLKSDPAFQDAHHRGHFWKFEAQREFAGFGNVAESVVVTALAAQAAAHPEIGDGDHLLVADFLFQRENGVKTFDGFGEFFFGDGEQAFGHAQMRVFEERERFRRDGGEA